MRSKWECVRLVNCGSATGDRERNRGTDWRQDSGTSRNKSKPCHPVPLTNRPLWSVCPPASDAFFHPRTTHSLHRRAVGRRPEKSVYVSPPERDSCSIESQQPGEVWGSLRAAAACCFFAGWRGLIIKAETPTSHFLCDDKRLLLPLDLMAWNPCCIRRKEVR